MFTGFGNTTPFGATPSTPSFGSQPTTFGAPAPTTSTFGSTTFGSTPSFGAQPTTTFGQPAATTGFGTTTGTTTGFGSTTFGANPTPSFGATTPGFGSTTTSFGSTPSTFGSTTGFGAPAPAATPSFGFGATTTQPSTGNIFGATTQPSSTGMFGTQPSTGLFGATTAASTTPFGAAPSATASPFGATTAAPTSSFGGFGATTSFGQPAMGSTMGTGNPPFKTTSDTDTGTNGQPLQHTAITAMPQYQNKSFEELRWEDIQVKKGNWSTSATPGFGATTTSTFGQPAAAAPASTGIFGSTTTGSTFGSAAPTTSFGFGATPAPSASPFGATTTQPASTGFSFGQPASTTTASPFGAPATQPTTQPSTSFGFGATTPAPTTTSFGFGATPSATTSPFGAPASQPATTSFGFGATSTSSPFGQPAASTAPKPATPGFGFGATTTQPATTSFGFGATTQPSATPGFGATTSSPFGQPAASTSTNLFGSTPSLGSTTASPFGQPATSTPNMFGTTPAATTAQPSNFSFNFGGATTAAPAASPFGATTSSFGATTTSTTPSFSFSTASPSPATGLGGTSFGSTFGATPGMVNTTAKTASISSPSPYGSMPPPMSPAVSLQPPPAMPTITPSTPGGRKPTLTSAYKLTPKSAAKIKPRGYKTPNKPGIFDETTNVTNISGVMSPDYFVARQNIKKLNIEPDEDEEEVSNTPAKEKSRNHEISMQQTPLTNALLRPVPAKGSLGPKSSQGDKLGRRTLDLDSPYKDFNELPHLTKQDYFTNPDRSELAQMSSEQLSAVINFSIGRKGVGIVQYLDPVDIRGLDLDSIIEFQHGEIVVYPDEDNKPNIGNGINKRARVTLEKLWPMDHTTNTRKMDDTSLGRYEEKMKRTTEKLGAKFIKYDRKSGDWIFQVEHFSRYGLLDDDEEEQEQQPIQAQAKTPLAVTKATTAAASPNRFRLSDSDSDDNNNISDNDINEPSLPVNEDFEQSEIMEDEEIPIEEEEEEEEESIAMDNNNNNNNNITEGYNVTNVRLPEQLGLDPTKMQVMKSYLFETDQEEKKPSPIVRRQAPLYYDRSSPARPVPAATESSDTERPSKRTDFRSPIALNDQLAIRPLPLQPKFPEAQVRTEPAKKVPLTSHIPFEKSVAYNSKRSLADASAFMGRSFRVSWGPNGTIAHSGFPIGRSKPHALFSMVTIETVFTVPTGSTTETVALLEEHSNHSNIFSSETGLPQLELNDVYGNVKENILKLNELLSNNTSSVLFIEQAKLIFQLIVALWDSDGSFREVFSGLTINSSEEYAENLARRMALNLWLKNTLLPIASKEAETTNNSFESIFSLLTAKQISEASVKAIETKNYHLATLIAQGCSNGPIREDLTNQLKYWKENGTSTRIDGKLWKIYQLLSGDINGVMQGLDWKRCFALLFWFGAQNNSPISDVIDMFDQSVAISAARPPVPLFFEGNYGELPFISYSENDSVLATSEDGTLYVWNSQGEYWAKSPLQNSWRKIESRQEISNLKKIHFVSVTSLGLDTTYHLLKLKSDPTYNLSRVISPNTSSPYALDYRLPWHLLSILQTIGYNHRFAYLNEIYFNYISQLEFMGLWTWSIYILLHLPEDQFEIKNKGISEIIGRHIETMTSQEEDFLFKKLKIPMHYFYEAKSWLCCYHRNVYDEVDYLIESKHWNKAHEIILEQIGPEYILKGKIEELEELLNKLYHHSNLIANWEYGGSLFLDYLRITSEFKRYVVLSMETNTTSDILSAIMSLDSLASSLSNRLQFVTGNANGKPKRITERVCYSEMGVQLAIYLKQIKRMLSLIKGETNNDKEILNAFPYVSGIDMPDDYKLNHFRDFVGNFLKSKEVASVF